MKTVKKVLVSILAAVVLLAGSIGGALSANAEAKAYDQKLLIDNADKTDGWFGTTVAVKTENPAVEGSAYLQAATVDDLGSAVLARTFDPPLNLAKYSSEGYLHIWVYVPDNAALGAGCIELSSSGTPDGAYIWNLKDYVTDTGWNELYLPVAGAAKGTADFSKINYFRMYAAAQTGLGLDDMYMCLEAEPNTNPSDSSPSETDPSGTDAKPTLPTNITYGSKLNIDTGDKTDGWFGTEVSVSTENPAIQGGSFLQASGVDELGSAVLARTFEPSLDLSEYSEEGYLHLWVYIPDKETLDAGCVELASSGTPDGAYKWNLKDYVTQAGWNELYLPVAKAIQGTADFSKINYFRMYAAGQEGLGVDDIYMCLAETGKVPDTGISTPVFVWLLLMAAGTAVVFLALSRGSSRRTERG